MSRIVRLLFVIAALGAVNLSCDVNDYCLNCKTGGDAGDNGDGGDGDGGLDDAGVDSSDAQPCVPSGTEVCDGEDNDCNGLVDDGTLPQVGDPCDNLMGECAGGMKQCTNGAITCTKPPMAESCDGKDNDCDGTIDDGNPGGGAKCGTDQGECVAGTFTCVNGSIDCVGEVGGTMAPFGSPETCNGKDDDCDGMVDDNAPVPSTFCDSNPDTGECNKGTPTCVGGGIVCVGVVGPSPELCDSLDQDCDGSNTNGYDLQNDPTNCGTCGNKCNLANALEGCASGQCTIAACEDGYHDNNNSASDGCEFGPCAIQGNEVCNGIDDDCDGLTDMADSDLVVPSVGSMCRTQNECSTAAVQCMGANGFQCVYPDPDVQETNGVIEQETLCDSKDNDCDGAFDEGQPTLGDSCTAGQGECQTTGTFVCNTNDLDGPAVCNAPPPGAGTTEVCDGKDNNCNGVIDDDAATGALAGQDWIDVPGTTIEMMKYEASHPDATTATGGTITTHVCSRPGVLPWTNVSYPEAVAACSSIGARLCSEAEWQRMCVPPVTYPAVGPATANAGDFTFIEAEDAFANVTVGGRTWATIAPLSFNGVTARQVPDAGAIVSPASAALANAPRMDFQLDLAASTTYTVWTRMRSPTVPAAVRGATAGTQTLAPVAPSTTQVGDLVIVTTWTWTTNNTVPTHTLQSGFTQLRTQDLNDGSTDGRLSIAYRVATAAGATSYQAYTSNTGTSFSGIVVVRAGQFDLNAIATSSTFSTADGAPDPLSVGTINAPSLVLAVGAWHYGGGSADVSIAPPATFTEQWELSGTTSAELSVATQTFAAGTIPNPGQFFDNVTGTTGNVAATIAIGLNRSMSAWVGLTAGTTAGAANTRGISTPADDQWHWVASPAFTTSTSGTHTFSIYMRDDGAIIDTIAVARQSTEGPTFDNSWSYSTNPRTPQPTTCNADDFDTNTSTAGDQDDIIATGSRAACFVEKGANDAYDMSGNVKEWALARSAGFNPLRGGASNNEVTGTTCKIDFSSGDNTFRFPNVGFRCCRD